MTKPTYKGEHLVRVLLYSHYVSYYRSRHGLGAEAEILHLIYKVEGNREQDRNQAVIFKVPPPVTYFLQLSLTF